MFKKLIKYDLTSVWRLWWIILLTMPCATVVGSIAFRFTIGSSDSSNVVDIIVTIFSGLLGMACFMVIPVAGVLTAILVYVRFYKNLFSDEGYLTFTLPVSRRSIFFSKTLNAYIWFSLYGVLAFLCVCAAALIIPPVNPGEGLLNPIVFEELYDVFRVLIEGIKTESFIVIAWITLYLFEIMLIFAVSQFLTINIVHFCMTMGSVIVKKAKILAAIGIYYGISVISSFATQIGLTIFTYGMSDQFVAYFNASGSRAPNIVAMILFIIILAISAVAAIFYCLTQWLIDRKLNLA